MSGKKYIGLDVRQATISVAVMAPSPEIQEQEKEHHGETAKHRSLLDRCHQHGPLATRRKAPSSCNA
jgi:hypothetical protein